MKYLFTTYKKRLVVAIICLTLLLPLNLALHKAYEAWPQFATKYSYLEDPRYQEGTLADLTSDGDTPLELWSEDYITTWTYFFAEEVTAGQLLRTVTLPDNTESEIRLSADEAEGIQSFLASGIKEFGVRTSWNYRNGAWEGSNTDLVTGEGDPSDPLQRLYITRGTLWPEHLENIQSMLEQSGEKEFMLHNDIVLPDGLRRQVYIDQAHVTQALTDIEAGRINSLLVESRWHVKSQAIWMQHLPGGSRGRHIITNLMKFSGQDNYQDFMYSILDRIVDLQILGNLALVMTVFIIGLTIGAQEKQRKLA